MSSNVIVTREPAFVHLPALSTTNPGMANLLPNTGLSGN
jgi:hypothetical protein